VALDRHGRQDAEAAQELSGARLHLLEKGERMNRWQLFLNSISTPGGNLLLLAIFVSAMFTMVVHVLENPHPNGDQAVTVILSTFSAFSGALLQALRGRSSDIPNNGKPVEAAKQ